MIIQYTVPSLFCLQIVIQALHAFIYAMLFTNCHVLSYLIMLPDQKENHKKRGQYLKPSVLKINIRDDSRI